MSTTIAGIAALAATVPVPEPPPETPTLDPDQDQIGPDATITPIPDARDARIAEIEAAIVAERSAVELAQRKAAALEAAAKASAVVKRDTSHALAVHRTEVANREVDRYLPVVESMVSTAGLPLGWTRVLRVGVPVLGHLAAGVVAGMSPESPGGKKLTRDELEDLVDAAAAEIRQRLLAELGGLVSR